MDSGGGVEDKNRCLVGSNPLPRGKERLNPGNLTTNAAVEVELLPSLEWIPGAQGTIRLLGLDTPQLVQGGQFALINALDPISQTFLGHADIFNQTLEPGRFHRSGLVAAPHCTVKRNVAFDQARAYGNRRNGRDQAYFMT